MKDFKETIPAPLEREISQNTTRYEVVADLIADTSHLAHLLDTDRSTARRSTEFSFVPGESDSALHMIYPDVIKDLRYSWTLDEVQIDITVDNDASQNTIAIRYLMKQDNETLVVFAHLENGTNYTTGTTLLSIDMPGTVDLPQSEAQRSILSLFMPSKNGNYSDFSALDLSDNRIVTSFIDALERKLVPVMEQKVHTLSDSGINLGQIEFIMIQGELVQSTIQHITSPAHVTEKGEIVNDKKIITTLDTTDGFSINQKNAMRRPGSKKAISTEELHILSDFIKSQLALPQHEEPDIGEYKEDDPTGLNQRRFNSTNTS